MKENNEKVDLITWIILSPGCSNFDAGPSGCTLVTNIPFNDNQKKIIIEGQITNWKHDSGTREPFSIPGNTRPQWKLSPDFSEYLTGQHHFCL